MQTGHSRIQSAHNLDDSVNYYKHARDQSFAESALNDSVLERSMSQVKINSYNRRRESRESKDLYLNLQLYEEHQMIDMKVRLEEELVRNEHLERKIRNLEFENLKFRNEQSRRIKELEFKNSQLQQQIKMIENSEGEKKDNEMMQGSYIMELENKLTQYETEILLLRDKESELLNQINNLKSENFDIRMQSQRFSFLANNPRRSFLPTVNETALFKNNSGNNVILNSSNINIQPGSLRPTVMMNNMQKLFAAPQKQGRQTTARFSVFSIGNGSRISINATPFGVSPKDEEKDINQVIAQLNQEKESLEQEIQCMKDKALNQILQKEKQIIELMKTHGKEVEDLKKENSRLQNDLIVMRKNEREKDQLDNLTVVKLERDLQMLKSELLLMDDKYQKLNQKCLEDKRQHEKEIAYLNDKYTNDINYYQAQVDKQKERVRRILDDNERMKKQVHQSQDFKQDVMNELQENEQRMRDLDKEKHQMEEEFKEKLSLKNMIIDEKTKRINQLQEQIFNNETQIKEAIAKEHQIFEQKLNEVKDQLMLKQEECENLDMELDDTKEQLQKQMETTMELERKKKMLSNLLEEMQEQKENLEANYQEKIEILEQQVEQNSIFYQQEINSIKLRYQMIDPEGAERINELKEIEEDLEEEKEGTESSCNSKFGSSQSPNSFSKKSFTSKHKQESEHLPTSLMDELNEDDNEYRFSVGNGAHMFQYNATNRRIFGGNAMSTRSSQISNYLERNSMMVGSNFQTYYQSNSNTQKLELITKPLEEIQIEQSDSNIEQKINYEQLIIELQEQLLQLQDQVKQYETVVQDKDQEITELNQQIQLMESEITNMKQSKEDLLEEVRQGVKKFAEFAKDKTNQIQDMRKKRVEELTQVKVVYEKQISLNSSELSKLKRKVKELESENEELIEQIITQKQQYSEEVNYLRIHLTETEEQVINAKLQHAQLLMEKDLISIKLQEYYTQKTQLREDINRVKESKNEKIKNLLEEEKKQRDAKKKSTKNLFTKQRFGVGQSIDVSKIDVMVDFKDVNSKERHKQ